MIGKGGTREPGQTLRAKAAAVKGPHYGWVGGSRL